ncbi:MAG: hemerythrin domain-containing protein [Actinomycetes bacterium]
METSVDITQLILDDHHEQRKMFAILDEIPRDDHDKLGAVWQRLEILLEVHAEAEEHHIYPHLLKLGHGAMGESVDSESEDAIKDHNEIRDAIKQVRQHEVGSDDWWSAVLEARKQNSDHMAEEEREDLADFRQHAPVELRHQLALDFAAYEAAHAGGVPIEDKDPKKYVQQHS